MSTSPPTPSPRPTIAALQAIPGIGPWTAQYIAMRALRWPDAWLVGDVALTKALGLPDHRGREAQREAEQRSQSWRPWRSYAVIRAWAQRPAQPIPPQTPARRIRMKWQLDNTWSSMTSPLGEIRISASDVGLTADLVSRSAPFARSRRTPAMAHRR